MICKRCQDGQHWVCADVGKGTKSCCDCQHWEGKVLQDEYEVELAERSVNISDNNGYTDPGEGSG